jgi:DNA-binding MurR/RpiR family transcriptional regulator
VFINFSTISLIIMQYLTKKQLQDKYMTMNVRDLAKELKVSVPTLMRELKDNDIPLKGARKKRIVK